MKIILRIVIAAVLLSIGFAAGFPIGRNVGFSTGSEWALVQAEIFAKEFGMFMPVRFEEGKFRVAYKQPPNLHARAWRLADKNSDKSSPANKVVKRSSGESDTIEHTAAVGADESRSDRQETPVIAVETMAESQAERSSDSREGETL